ncbi:MAG: hypothetical protein AVDCRST_MAG15-491, partial [uncultured Rubellimicrobium sp.]
GRPLLPPRRCTPPRGRGGVHPREPSADRDPGNRSPPSPRGTAKRPVPPRSARGYALLGPCLAGGHGARAPPCGQAGDGSRQGRGGNRRGLRPRCPRRPARRGRGRAGHRDGPASGGGDPAERRGERASGAGRPSATTQASCLGSGEPARNPGLLRRPRRRRLLQRGCRRVRNGLLRRRTGRPWARYANPHRRYRPPLPAARPAGAAGLLPRPRCGRLAVGPLARGLGLPLEADPL